MKTRKNKNIMMIGVTIIISIALIIGILSIKKTIQPSPGCEQEPQYFYDSNGSLIKIDYGECSGYGVKSINYWYENDNLIRERTALFLEGEKYFYEKNYEYDANNNLIHYDSPLENDYYEYDEQGRILLESINGENFTYSYTNDTIFCINCEPGASDIPRYYEYDDSSNLIRAYVNKEIIIEKEIDVNGRVSKASNELVNITYHYDENGSLTSFISEGNLAGTFSINECGSFDNYSYDENCSLIQDDYYSYAYDENRSLTSQTNLETGEITSYEYDEEYRLIKTTYADGSYDSYEYGAGGLYKITDNSGDVFYLSPVNYDEMMTQEQILELLTSCLGDCGEIETNYNCSDGIQNGYEEGIDCGLSCWTDCNQTEEFACSETDSGNDINNKGVTTGYEIATDNNIISKEDFCYNNYQVDEFFCNSAVYGSESPNPDDVNNALLDCSEGNCYDGECTNLAVYYKFENNADEQVNSLNSSLKNGIGFETGVKDLGLKADGIDDYAETSYNSKLNLNQFSISAWVKYSGKTWNPFISRDDGATKRVFNFRTQGTNNQLALIVWNTQNSAFIATNNIVLNSWNHVAGVFDGSSLVVYVNGVAGTPIAFTGSIAQNNLPLLIGKGAGTNQYFQGSLDELKIWNKALTGEEVLREYQS